jgi:hypothetical protein
VLLPSIEKQICYNKRNPRLSNKCLTRAERFGGNYISGKHEIAKIKKMKALVISSYDTKTSKSGA